MRTSYEPGRRFRMGAALAAVTALAFVASGCGDDETTSTTTSTEAGAASGPTGATGAEVSNTVEVSETEYALTPSNVEPGSDEPGETITSTAKSGKVTFQITNDGEETHSFVFNDAGKEIDLGKDLAPGESAEMTVDVDSGFYEYYCPIDDHQGLGMQGQIEVK
jgi:uncharacterized cupredoxin-like copper-binding protein